MSPPKTHHTVTYLYMQDENQNKENCRIQTHNRKKYNGVKEIYTRITVLIPIEADIKGDLILLWYEFLNDFTRLEGAILRFSGQSSQTHNCEGRK